MVIYSYHVEKKKKIYSLSLDSYFLMLWTILGLGRDNYGIRARL